MHKETVAQVKQKTGIFIHPKSNLHGTGATEVSKDLYTKDLYKRVIPAAP